MGPDAWNDRAYNDLRDRARVLIDSNRLTRQWAERILVAFSDSWDDEVAIDVNVRQAIMNAQLPLPESLYLEGAAAQVLTKVLAPSWDDCVAAASRIGQRVGISLGPPTRTTEKEEGKPMSDNKVIEQIPNATDQGDWGLVEFETRLEQLHAAGAIDDARVQAYEESKEQAITSWDSPEYDDIDLHEHIVNHHMGIDHGLHGVEARYLLGPITLILTERI